MNFYPHIEMADLAMTRPSTRKLSPRDLRDVANLIRTRAKTAREPSPFVELIATAPLAFRVRWQSRPAPEGRFPSPAQRILRIHVMDLRNRPLAVFDTMLADAGGTRPVAIRHDRAQVRAEVGWLRPDGKLAAVISSTVVAAIPGTPSPVRSDWLRDIRRGLGHGKPPRHATPPAVSMTLHAGQTSGAGLSGEGWRALASGRTGGSSPAQGWPLPRKPRGRGKRS